MAYHLLQMRIGEQFVQLRTITWERQIYIGHWIIKNLMFNLSLCRMLRWGRGKTRLDHIRNEDTRKEAHITPVDTFLDNKRLKWFGHCLRRQRNHICAKSLRLEVSGRRRSRSRPKKRWRDNIKKDIKKYQLTEDMAQDRTYWMTKITAG